MYPIKIPHNYDPSDLGIIFYVQKKSSFLVDSDIQCSEVKMTDSKLRDKISWFHRWGIAGTIYAKYHEKTFCLIKVFYIYCTISWNQKKDYVLRSIEETGF